MIRITFGAKIFGLWKFLNPLGGSRVIKNTMYLSMMVVYRRRQNGAEGKREEGEAVTEGERDGGGGSDSYPSLSLFLS